MRVMRPMLLLAAAVCFGAVAWAGPARTAQDLDIIPTPKEVRLTKGQFDLVQEGKPTAIIVLAAKPSRQAEIGAEEINDAVVSASGAALPVKTLDTLTPSERNAASLILVGQPGENSLLVQECTQRRIKLSADDPGPQGYQMRFVRDDKRRLTLLAGCDPLGMLYACVTFRHLIRGDEENAYAIEATIRDWPDVRWRFTWTVIRPALRATFGYDGQYRPARAEAGMELAKRQLDWFLRHKINIFNCRGMYWKDKESQLWNRKVLEYAFDRGIWGWDFGARATQESDASLGSAPVDTPKPELEVCFTHKRGKQAHYWCWSRDEMMQRRYEEAARTLAASMPKSAEVGGMILVLHMPDCGNMGWHYRCEQCKKRFGNNQAAAQANVFNHFYRAMRKYLPNSKIVLVPRPYVLFDFDAPENRVYRERFEKLAPLIPADSYLVHVSGTREAVESWKRICSPVHLAHWVNAGPSDLPLDFISNKTYYVGPDDMYFQGKPYPGGELEVLGAVEYMWNIEGPGSICYRNDPKQPYTLRPWSDTGDTPDQVRKHQAAFSNPVAEGVPKGGWWPLEQKAGTQVMGFLERAARQLYGEKAAPYMLRIKGSGYIPRYYEWWYERYATPDSMRSQAQGLEAAAQAYEALVTQKIGVPNVLTGEVSVPSARLVIESYSNLAQARVEMHVLEAKEAIREAQWPRAAEALTNAENTLTAESQLLREVFDRMKPYRKYPGEIKEDLLTDVLDSLAQLKPKMEVLKIELRLRQELKRFPARPLKPHYQKGKMRVAIYQPPQGEGRVIGAQGIYQALGKDTDLQVAYIDNLKLGTLLGYHCLIFPACTQMPPEDFGRIADVRRFVGEYGGGVYIQHSSVGHPRFPLRNSMFPEVCEYADRLDSNRVTVVAARPAGSGDQLAKFEMAAHPVVGTHQVGAILEHMYYDHMTLGVQGREGVTVLVDAKTKAPVVVVGQVGQGRVVFDGSVALASPKTAAGKKLAAQLGKDPNIDNFEYPTFGFSRELLLNAVRWLCGK